MFSVLRWSSLLVLSVTAPGSFVATSSAGELAPSAKETMALKVGSVVPAALMVKTPGGKDFDLSKALTEKPTVLVFVRGGWCPYCSQHLSDLADIEEKLLQLGVRIIALSTDQTKNLKSVAEANHVNYTLLSDRGMVASAAFGVSYRVANDMQKKYVEWGIDVPSVPNDPASRWLPVPAAFVIGTDRVVKFSYSDPDYTVRISADKLLEAAKAAFK